MSVGHLNPQATLRVEVVGTEREPVLIVEDAARDPHALVRAAAAASFQPAYGPAGGYPGIRAPAPLDYVEQVVRALDPFLRDAFGLSAVRLSGAECFFSLVTLPAADLVAQQREPHVDTSDPLQFAILHYLCGPGFGGTDFYRHRATGIEAVDAERVDRYAAIRAAERTAGGGGGYVGGDDPWFVRTGGCDARFNRLVAYRSLLLHSGRIGDEAKLSADPRQGRLTANIFVTYRPA